MSNLIVIIAVLAIVTAAALYVYRAKKRGAKCVGCPHAKQCGAEGGCPCQKP